jgi:hypothetical protein
MGIASGQPGSCPTDCDSGDSCIAGTLYNGGTCAASCRFAEITAPANGDGCCPAGANAINDNDCLPVCGNGVCEVGEEVDCLPDCECVDRFDCNDSYACTFDECVGGICNYTLGRYPYGDVDLNAVINLFDIFCVLEGIAGDFSTCELRDDDIHPCGGNDVLNLFDVFAVLDAISGTDPCCGG